MGCCGSEPVNPEEYGDPKQNKAVDQELVEDREKAKKVHKLLLLGPGNSGKSTFFKQLTQIHGDGFSSDDKQHAIQYIYDAILDQMKNLLISAKEEFKHDLPEEIATSVEYIERLPRDIPINADIAEHITTLWKEELIKKTFEDRTTLGIVDSSPYFFSNIDRIAAEQYLPTVEDILLARIPTTGIREASFEIKDNIFEIYDVGGQRSERSKWIHCFDGVHAVMFVTSLSCYDQKLYEEADVNAMDEALELWDQVVNSPYFANKRTSMIIFFNKSDLFENKIAKKPLTICFPEYAGPDGEFGEAVEYIREVFLEKNEDSSRQIYTHVTCATDQQNVERVFHDVQHGVVLNALTKNGIL